MSVDLYKIITYRGKKKIYESKAQFERQWKRHKEDRAHFVKHISSKSFPTKPLIAYQLQGSSVGPSFRWAKYRQVGK